MPAELEEAGVDIGRVGPKDLAPDLVERAFGRRPRQHRLARAVRGAYRRADPAGAPATRCGTCSDEVTAPPLREREKLRRIERRVRLFQQPIEILRADKDMPQIGMQDALEGLHAVFRANRSLEKRLFHPFEPGRNLQIGQLTDVFPTRPVDRQRAKPAPDGSRTTRTHQETRLRRCVRRPHRA